MSLGKETDTVISFKKFVSADELEEARKKRQEEWEKVRKPDDPEEVPEEPYDPRSLFEQLQEQKLKKEEEYAEKQRFSNQVKRLDEDEVEFLDFVSQKQEEITQKREAEDAEVLEEYRSALLNKATSPTSPVLSKPSLAKTSSGSKATKKSQLELLAGAVKRKSTESQSSEPDSKKTKADASANSDNTEDKLKASAEITKTASESRPMTAQVIGVLPGLGVYYDSDSSSSSESEIELPPDIFQGGRPLLAHSQDD